MTTTCIVFLYQESVSSVCPDILAIRQLGNVTECRRVWSA